MAGQSWAIAARGGALTSTVLSRKLRVAAQPIQVFRQYVRPEEEFGRNMGDTLQFDKAGNISQRGRVHSEFETVQESNISFTTDTVTAKEFTNSIPYTWTVELLARLDIRSAIINALKDDMAITLDIAVSLEFKNTDLKYTPTGTYTTLTYNLATNGTPGTSTRNITVWDLKNIADAMKSDYRMPKFDGKDFNAVCTTAFLRGIKDDSEFVEASKYGDPQNLFDGEVGRFYGVRMTEETNALDNTLAGGLGEAVIFGKDAVVEIAVYPEEIQAKVGADYGRDRGLRWVWVGGFKRTWDYSSEGEARAVHVSSLT